MNSLLSKLSYAKTSRDVLAGRIGRRTHSELKFDIFYFKKLMSLQRLSVYTVNLADII